MSLLRVVKGGGGGVSLPQWKFRFGEGATHDIYHGFILRFGAAAEFVEHRLGFLVDIGRLDVVMPVGDGGSGLMICVELSGLRYIEEEEGVGKCNNPHAGVSNRDEMQYGGSSELSHPQLIYWHDRVRYISFPQY